jgi:hypothetical protein
MDIVAEDSARALDNIDDYIDDDGPEEFAADIVHDLRYKHLNYTPLSPWDLRRFYLEMLVEKIDLKTLFGPKRALSYPARQCPRLVRPQYPMGNASAHPEAYRRRQESGHPLLR